MSLKSNVEKLFGYRLNPKQVPNAIIRPILEELFPGHLALGVLGFGAEGCVIKTNAWVDDNEKKQRINFAIKIAAQEFVREEYEPAKLVNLYTARTKKTNRDRARFLNGINCQKFAYELPKTPLSLVIPKVLQVIEEPWLAFCMEFVEGISLLQFLDETKDFATSMRLYLNLLKGVEEIHNSRLIHRDLKPENIIVCGNRQLHPQLCLLDWTSSKLLDVEWSNTLPGTTRIGTVPYASDKLTIDRDAQDACEADDVEPLATMIFEFVNFSKIPPPDFCTPSQLAENREMKRRYRDWIREGIPEPLRRVYDFGGEEKFQKVGPLIWELGQAFLEMDFNPERENKQKRQASLEERVERLEKLLARVAEILEGK